MPRKTHKKKTTSENKSRSITRTVNNSDGQHDTKNKKKKHKERDELNFHLHFSIPWILYSIEPYSHFQGTNKNHCQSIEPR